MRRKLFAAFCLTLCAFAVYKVNASNNMVYVKGGTFQMSSDNNGKNPEHTVTVSSFYIGKYEVTQAEYAAIMGDIPGNFKGEQRPVEYVNWYGAVKYCNKRSKKEGLTPCYTIDWINYWPEKANVTCDWSANGYRLPTEAEWEYAARGGKHKSTYRYSGSDNIDEVAWYSGNSGNQTHEVGKKNANALGLYDMSGNVWEWCWDWYNRYSGNAENNPLGPASGSYRVFRGGGWNGNAGDCRVTDRLISNPDGRRNYLGFRVARSGK